MLASLALLALSTLGSEDVKALFNGKDLAGWKAKNEKSRWVVGLARQSATDPALLESEELASEGEKGDLINLVEQHGQGTDLFTTAKVGDCLLELEVMVPQGSNSGIYLMGEYEVQVLDSFGKKEMGMGDMGAIYGATPPKVNATRPPGEWQSYRIEFEAPRFDDSGQKVANARFRKVTLNGKVIQADVEMKGVTPGGLTGKESAEGPLMFQGDHGPVAYRNIRVSPLPPAAAGG